MGHLETPLSLYMIKDSLLIISIFFGVCLLTFDLWFVSRAMARTAAWCMRRRWLRRTVTRRLASITRLTVGAMWHWWSDSEMKIYCNVLLEKLTYNKVYSTSFLRSLINPTNKSIVKCIKNINHDQGHLCKICICASALLSMEAYMEFTHLTGIGAAALTLVLVEPFLVPNFSCLLRTSRGGLATEFTKAIFTWRPVRETHG